MRLITWPLWVKILAVVTLLILVIGGIVGYKLWSVLKGIAGTAEIQTACSNYIKQHEHILGSLNNENGGSYFSGTSVNLDGATTLNTIFYPQNQAKGRTFECTVKPVELSTSFTVTQFRWLP